MEKDYSTAIVVLEKQKKEMNRWVKKAQDDIENFSIQLSLAKENLEDLYNKLKEIDKAIDFLK